MEAQNVLKGTLPMSIDWAYSRAVFAFFRNLKLDLLLPKHLASRHDLFLLSKSALQE